jgi:hypothetical protein
VPQLVVVGNENAGKSTLLERLCMMPIFPHDEDICTRMRIQVRLRRGAAQAPRLEVFNLRTKKREGAVKTVPTETANVDVREAMGRLLSQQQRCITGVTADHMLILHVQSPSVPTLDLVDLPGIMAIAASDEPADMPAQTKALVANHIDESKDYSVFLACVDASLPPNQSEALKLLQQKNVLDKTIGTCCTL